MPGRASEPGCRAPDRRFRLPAVRTSLPPGMERRTPLAMALTRRQQIFAHEYLVDLNATQAAIRAGYSARSARVQGVRMITNANISEFIDNAIAERLERLGLTADRVIEQWAAIVFASMGDFLTADEYGCPTWDFEKATRTTARRSAISASTPAAGGEGSASSSPTSRPPL